MFGFKGVTRGNYMLRKHVLYRSEGKNKSLAPKVFHAVTIEILSNLQIYSMNKYAGAC